MIFIVFFFFFGGGGGGEEIKNRSNAFNYTQKDL